VSDYLNKPAKVKGLNFLPYLTAIALPLSFISSIKGCASSFAWSYVTAPCKNFDFSSLKKLRYLVSMVRLYILMPDVSIGMYGKIMFHG